MRELRWFRVLKCAVCGFPFSDKHHIYPQAAGGRLSSTIALCPNHHRCAHMIYTMVDAGASDEYILHFSEAYFDEVFQRDFADDLLTDYRLTKATMTLARRALYRWLVDAAIDSL